MTRMTGPDCAVMCNLINTHTHTHKYTHTHTHTKRRLDHVTSCASDAHKQDGVTLDMDMIWIDTRIDNHRTEHARVVATLPM